MCFEQNLLRILVLFVLRVQFGSGCAALVFTSVEPAVFARMRTDANQKDIYIYIYIHTCVCLSHVAHQHTQRTLIVSVTWWCLFSLGDHWVSADRSVNRRRRGSRSLRRARSPNSWRHHSNTLQYHCALGAPAAIMVSRRFWDSSSNLVYNSQSAEKRDTSALGAHGSGP